jgi:hypothetical protein
LPFIRFVWSKICVAALKPLLQGIRYPLLGKRTIDIAAEGKHHEKRRFMDDGPGDGIDSV